jgi:hypothetical protein
MILIDYFLYKIYAFFLNKPFHETLVANNALLLSLDLNVSSLLIYLGYPIWDDNIRYSLVGGFILGQFIMYFFYEKKGRYKKIYEKFKNENRFWKVFGWVWVLIYIVATIIFAIYC